MLEYYSSTSKARAITGKQWLRELGLAGIEETRHQQQQ